MAYGSYNRTAAESNIMSSTSNKFLGSGAMSAFTSFKGDTRPSGGEVGSLLGAAKGNVAQRQRIITGKDGQPQRTSATDAILYKQASVAGKFGFRSAYTNRYRNKNRTLQSLGILSQSKGPNKAPHGVAQSSLDSTRERYSTFDTRFGKSRYDSDERWNPQSKRFERQWNGFDKLDIKQRGQHYAQNAAQMFKQKNIDVGAARRGHRLF